MRKMIFLTAILVLTASVVSAQSNSEENFKLLSRDILENLQSFYPVTSTERGIHTYDYRFTDYSEASIKAEISKLKGFETKLSKYDTANFSFDSRINLRLIKSNVDIALLDLSKIKSHVSNPYFYISDAVNGIYLILVSEYPPLETRTQNVIARLKAVPDLINQARQNLKNPTPLFVDMALEMCTTGVDFYMTVEDDLSSEFPGLASEIEMAASRAISSVMDYRAFLEKIRRGTPLSFAIGKVNFDYKLQHEYFLDYDSDSLLKIGENLFKQADSMYKAYILYLETTPTNVDSVFAVDCITRDDVLRYYNWELDQTRQFLEEKNIVTVPEDIGDCLVLETPPILTGVISSIAYQPPGVYNSDQTGHLYVRPIPDSMDAGQREARFKYIIRRGFRSSVAHEVFPGQHLHFQLAAKLTDDIRKWQKNACLYEGWALYCEEMMFDNGFYGTDKRPYLNILGGIRFRAARIIVDVKLHTGKMTPDEAVKWMTEALDSDSDFYRIEVNRYCTQPTIPMSHLIGKREIMALREAVRARDGDKFSLKDFHDILLAEGALPPKLLWDIWKLR